MSSIGCDHVEDGTGSAGKPRHQAHGRRGLFMKTGNALRALLLSGDFKGSGQLAVGRISLCARADQNGLDTSA